MASRNAGREKKPYVVKKFYGLFMPYKTCMKIGFYKVNFNGGLASRNAGLEKKFNAILAKQGVKF